MQLTVREAAELLRISEDLVYRRIKDGSLPAQKIAGQYRFNRAELLEWATANGFTVSPQLFGTPDEEEIDIPPVSAALEKGGIHHDVPGGAPRATLESVVRLLPLPTHVDRSFLVDVLMAREALGSTAVGDGIAIPHVRNPIVLDPDQQPIVSLCFLRESVDFGALDGKPVFALFTLVCPTIRVHLQMLSRLAFVLSDPKFRRAVKEREAPELLLSLARSAEARIPAPRSGGE